ncbi:C40 family peptidase [Actinotalea fermentans]|uniref:hypothetical protein n=1 Tax=Actinotalea fermentans TaxID=43671 RepID=UPI0005590040|nr:hypothetical protein [Actinotalea fermentans]
MPDAVPLDRAIDLTRTGDLWLFRGRSLADRAIQLATNSPVNHVGMAVVIDDLPPLMWHAELGRSIPDAWTGEHQRGAQLHDLRAAVTTWVHKYGQQPWFRQLHVPATPAEHQEMEDAVLRTVAQIDGTPFPRTVRLAARWLWGHAPTSDRLERVPGVHAVQAVRDLFRDADARTEAEVRLERAYCAEIVALTFEAMGLLPGDRRASGFDPGDFWSGGDLELLRDARLGAEIAVDVPPRADAA